MRAIGGFYGTPRNTAELNAKYTPENVIANLQSQINAIRGRGTYKEIVLRALVSDIFASTIGVNTQAYKNHQTTILERVREALFNDRILTSAENPHHNQKRSVIGHFRYPRTLYGDSRLGDLGDFRRRLEEKYRDIPNTELAKKIVYKGIILDLTSNPTNREINEYSNLISAFIRTLNPPFPTGSGFVDYDKLKGYSISDKDFEEALGLKPFLYYPDLQHLTSADQLFDKQGRCAVLFLTTSLYHGHWTCLMKRGTIIEYWDSYGGYAPDGERKWLSHNELVNLHEDQPLLSNLLRKSKYKILYNPYPYQSHSPQTNTCGKHCITRLYYKALKEPQYRRMIKQSGKTPDQFVIDFVYNLIGK